MNGATQVHPRVGWQRQLEAVGETVWVVIPMDEHAPSWFAPTLQQLVSDVIESLGFNPEEVIASWRMPTEGKAGYLGIEGYEYSVYVVPGRGVR